MRIALALYILLSSFFALATPVFAGELSKTAYVAVGNAYPFQDFGLSGSKNPVIQGGHTWTKGDVGFFDSASFDVWGSAGKRDKYHGATELDLTATGTKKIGPAVVSLSGAYYFFNKKLASDALDAHVDIAVPIKAGSATVSPFIRLTHFRFIKKGVGTTDLVRPGVRVYGPITDSVSYSVEASVSQNKTARVDTDRLQGDLNWDVGQPSGWTFGARVKITENVEPAGFLTGSYAY